MIIEDNFLSPPIIKKFSKKDSLKFKINLRSKKKLREINL